MKPDGTEEYNSISWVKRQLDGVLLETQGNLSAYIENTDDSAKLQSCIDNLRLVYGTLQMVEVYGAAMLAEEMEKTARAQLEGKVDRAEDVFDVLMRAMLQLPDYLESLQSGHKDTPIALMPLINDLRAARRDSLLSENVLFLPDVQSVVIDSDHDAVVDIPAGKLHEEARRLRPHYQLGLLDYLKHDKQAAGPKRMLAVVNALEKASADAAVRRMWMVVAALIEAILQEGIDGNISVKMLLGGVDRQIKLLIDTGEAEFVDNYSQDLLRNLLYYIGRSTSSGARVTQISKAYRLEELLPSVDAAGGYDAGMGGLNAELFDTVSRGINEDLAQVKDTLEIYVHSSERNVANLAPLLDQLGRIADTYGMLGIGSARQRVQNQRAVIEKMLHGKVEDSDNQIMDIAGELLTAESELRNFVAQRAGQAKASFSDTDSPIPSAEFRQVLATVIKQGLQNFTVAKEAILTFVSGIGQQEQLEIILTKLEEVRGIALMMPMTQIESMLSNLMSYVRIALRDNMHRPAAQEQDTVADIVTAIEYYLEAVAEGRPGVEAGLRTGERAAEQLMQIVAQFPQHAKTQTPHKPAVSDALTARVSGSEYIDIKSVAAVPDIEFTAAARKLDKSVGTRRAEEYAILADDADQEIVEIFIEEALEVLDELHANFPRWKVNNEDMEALTTVRRAFHTLKGSGRLLGAQLIGEFSWKIENTLNRVIDGKITASPALFASMEEAFAVLPQLIEQINGNREPVANVHELMATFDELSAALQIAADADMETEFDIASAIELTPADTAADNEIQFSAVVDDTEMIELEADDDNEIEIAIDVVDDVLAVAEFDITELAASNIEMESLDMDSTSSANRVAEGSDDDSEEVVLEFEQPAQHADIANSNHTLAIEVAGVVESDEAMRAIDSSAVKSDEYLIEIDEASAERAGEHVPGLAEIDPVLFRIYYDESISHIELIESLLAQHASGAARMRAEKNLVRAFHTLYGSARTADIEPIAEICGAAEKYIKARQDSTEQFIPDDVVELIIKIKDAVRAKLDELSRGRKPRSEKSLYDGMTRLVQAELKSQLQRSSKTSDVSVAYDELDVETEVLPQADMEQGAQTRAVDSSKPLRSANSAAVSYNEIDNDLIDIFLEEADEILESCEASVLKVVESPDDSGNLRELQRYMHTLKGGARMAELTPVGDLTHNLESLMIMLGEGKVRADKALFDTMHEALDVLTAMLANVRQREPIVMADELNAHIEMLMRGEAPEKRALERFDVELEELADIAVEKVERRRREDVIGNTAAHADDDAAFSRRANDDSADTSHWGERASDSARDTQEQVRVRADLLNSLVNYAGEVNIYHARMGKQITDVSFNLSELEQTVVRLKEQLRKLEIETEIQIRSNYAKVADQYGKDFDPLEMDRYSTLQQLSRSLSETAGDVESINGILREIVRDSETLLLQESRVSTDLQEGLMRTRMVRFGGLGTRLRRIVRQTAKELRKEVELEIVGDSNEVDRTVLDRIIAPMEHMLRNAVAHGIESPDKRRSAGKAETGLIVLSVDRQGADVVIRVKDDGAGINAAAIRKKAIERGLMEADSNLTDHDILQFILKSGFSTATEVTQVSGRGVGMDVVDSEIKQLGGLLEIDTRPGKGTTFIVRLPLTLAINQALLVNAADDVYAVPLASIEGVVRITGSELQRFYVSGHLNYVFNNVEYELKHLGKLLTGQQADYADQHRLFPVLLARVGDQHYALHVDDLVGRREIVVKPVGLQIGLVRGIAGATILADGRVVLILEMSALVVGESLFKKIEEEVVVAHVPEETTIMVVDDSITIRKVTERILLRNGLKVLLAKDGIDATNILQDHKPDLMLLDIEMPRMDGFELATYIRNDERLKDLPIIMITSRTGSKHKEKAMAIGVNQYLGKPYQEEELMKNINSLLAGHA